MMVLNPFTFCFLEVSQSLHRQSVQKQDLYNPRGYHTTIQPPSRTAKSSKITKSSTIAMSTFQDRLPKATDFAPAILFPQIKKLNESILYEKLPDEIKLRVVRYAFPEDRVVQVRFGQHPSSKQYDFATDVPAVFRVCHMWCEEANKFSAIIKSNIMSTKNPQ